MWNLKRQLAEDDQESVNTGAQLGPTVAGEILQHVRPGLHNPERSSAGRDDGHSDQGGELVNETWSVSYTHLRAHET